MEPQRVWMAKRRAVNDETFRWPRVVSITAVLVLHAGFLMVLLAPATRWRWDENHRSASPADTLRVRFLALPPPRHVVAPPPRHRPRVVPLPETPLLSVHRTQQAPAPAISASVATPPMAVTTTNAAPSYVPGGGRFGASSGYGSSDTRLPGSAAPVRGAPVFPMADPRMQGIAGVARVVQSLFGIPDHHCVEVDAWRTLTPDQRLERHIDDAQIDDTAARYGCGPGKEAGRPVGQRIQSMRQPR